MTAIKFAAISPHPPIIVPEIGRGREREAQATLDALAQVAQELQTQAPKTVVLIATHGPLRPASFVVLGAPYAEGDFAQWSAPSIHLRFDVDEEAVQAIVQEARGLPLEQIGHWNGGLDWSCTVPLYHLRSSLEGVRLVFLSISFLSPRQHFALGQAARRALDRLGSPAAIIASADLSIDCPPKGLMASTPPVLSSTASSVTPWPTGTCPPCWIWIQISASGPATTRYLPSASSWAPWTVYRCGLASSPTKALGAWATWWPPWTSWEQVPLQRCEVDGELIL